MRKIEKLMLLAIRSGFSFADGNTEVYFHQDKRTFDVYLYGNLIAKGHRFNDSGIKVDSATFAGHDTRTTRSRLRALGVDVDAMARIQRTKGTSTRSRQSNIRSTSDDTDTQGGQTT